MGTIAGYALSRYEFKRWKNIDIITWFLSLRFLPAISVAIPFYALIKFIGLLDNQLAVILIHSAFFMPYAVLIARDAFKSLTREIEEAAMVDGASLFTILWRIAIPMVTPTIMAIFILLFAFSWNEFLFAFLITSRKAVTMPVHIAGSVTTIGVLFYTLSVRQLLAMIPPVALAMLIQRYIVSGLTLGAVKG
ncbi:TPA: carbohydrate ABC transporter permease [Candidatus Bathyarchaeota archaeon]|nr:carbohydrate ABC transporter permease [Candidatus Bathyarchaeota archaeon]